MRRGSPCATASSPWRVLTCRRAMCATPRPRATATRATASHVDVTAARVARGRWCSPGAVPFAHDGDKQDARYRHGGRAYLDGRDGDAGVRQLARVVASSRTTRVLPCSLLVEAWCVQRALQWRPPRAPRSVCCDAYAAPCDFVDNDNNNGDGSDNSHTSSADAAACSQHTTRWLVEQLVGDRAPLQQRCRTHAQGNSIDDDDDDGDAVHSMLARLSHRDVAYLLEQAVRDDGVTPRHVAVLTRCLLQCLHTSYANNNNSSTASSGTHAQVAATTRTTQSQAAVAARRDNLQCRVDALLRAATAMHTSSVVLALTTQRSDGTDNGDDGDSDSACVRSDARVWRRGVTAEVARVCVQHVIAAVRRCHGCGAPPHDVAVLHALHTCARAALASLCRALTPARAGDVYVTSTCTRQGHGNNNNNYSTQAHVALLCMRALRYAPVHVLCREVARLLAIDRRVRAPLHDRNDNNNNNNKTSSSENSSTQRRDALAHVHVDTAEAVLHSGGGVVSRELLNKCLAQCAMTIDTVTQRGLCVHDADVAVVRCAMRLLQTYAEQPRRPSRDACRAVQGVEEGLVHGCALLNALGESAAVRALHTRLPQLRTTAHVVYACVAQHNVTAALDALASLARSRGDAGWPRLSLHAWQVMHAVCALVGERGAAGDVARLYVALVSFRNPSLMVGQLMNSVLAGVCARVTHAIVRVRCSSSSSTDDNNEQTGTSVGVAPHVLVAHIVPIFSAVLCYTGDDCSPDMVLELLVCALRLRDGAVAVVTALVAALQRATSLSLRSLCARTVPVHTPAATDAAAATQRASTTTTTDIAATQHVVVSFVHYYVLYSARHLGRHDVYEHLCTVWQLDTRTPHHTTPTTHTTLNARAADADARALPPPCRAWTCPACARVNSDRYSYCLCSAMRDGMAVCAHCGYAQDERLASCRSCGRRTHTHAASPSSSPSSSSRAAQPTRATTKAATRVADADAVAVVVVRQAWTCSACGAQSPARQQLCCVHCRRPTGPLLAASATQAQQRHTRHHDASPAAPAPLPLPPPFCACAASDAYTRRVGYCCRCNTYRTRHAAVHAQLWRCACCQQLRSSLERFCPSCPHVEYLPAAVVVDHTHNVATTTTAAAEAVDTTTAVAATASRTAVTPPPPPPPSPRCGHDDDADGAMAQPASYVLRASHDHGDAQQRDPQRRHACAPDC